MTALYDVAAHIAEQPVDLADLAPRLGIGERDLALFRRYYGLREVRMAPHADGSDLIVAAARQLKELKGNEPRVGYVVRARTVPGSGGSESGGPDNQVHRAAAELGLGHATAFTVTQTACASGLAAVDLAGRLLAEDGDPDALALVVAGEKTDWPTARLIPRTTVMGESSAACLVSAGGTGDVMLSYVSRTYGEFSDVNLPEPQATEFGRGYPARLTSVISDAASQAGLAVDDLAWILPHNVNQISWARAARLLDFPRQRIYLDNVSWLGHCFGADTFINYTSLRDRCGLRSGDCYLMATAGQGATFAAAVFRYQTSWSARRSG